MKNSVVKIMGTDGKEQEEISLPSIFKTPYLPEVIKKTYVNLDSHSYQRQGRYPAAGEIVSAESRNTGLGIARIARARGEGFPRAGQAAGVAGVRHGRVAHPPQSWKKINKKINKKEKFLGLCSAIAATSQKTLVLNRGHKVENLSNFPIIVSNEIEEISKTKELKNILENLGMTEELQRVYTKKSSKNVTSALIVVSNDAKLTNLDRSVPGVSVIKLQSLSVLDLAPGAKPIRLTIFSKKAIEDLKTKKSSFIKIMELISQSE